MVKPQDICSARSVTDLPVQPVEWRISRSPVAYADAVADMERRVADVRSGTAPECVWLLEHPPLYTAGTSAAPSDLLTPDRFPVFRTGRGGQYTYHGPGQRIAYVMLDLTTRRRDVRAFVCALEDWVIALLKRFGVTGERRKSRIGVWVARPELGPNREDKIAAIGVRVRRWVTFHGLSLNVDPDLEHYSGIVPCGVQDHGITSLADLGVSVSMEEVDQVLREVFEDRFGPVRSPHLTLSA